MEPIPRLLDIQSVLARKSCFLFGPRQTGKTWLIKNSLAHLPYFNLLDHVTYTQFAYAPQVLGERLQGSPAAVIDEIQRLPILLNEVQRLIDERGIHFLLTGSSARKLKRRGVNLLGGRARIRRLHPFSRIELGSHFNLNRALGFGLLPPVFFSDDPWEDLESYIAAYLQEEIAAEALVRNIPAFSRFLTVAALCNSGILNYANISSDAQVASSTVQEYFQILRDTYIAMDLPVWKKTVRRKPVSTSKVYFFDIGVVRCLRRQRSLAAGTPEYGEAFESFIHHELRSFVDYTKGGELHYWRSRSGWEVDFIVNDSIAVEVKSKITIGKKDLKDLRALKEEELLDRYILVYTGSDRRITDEGFEIMPYDLFLETLWAGDFSR